MQIIYQMVNLPLVVGRGACQTICLGFTSKHINDLLSTYNCNKFY